MCLFDMCSRVVFFSVIIMCVQFPFCDVYLCRWHALSPLCAKSPHLRKPMKMKDKILSIVFPYLVCFHAFWMCFRFVVCSCVFSICVHVWCFFLWLSCVSNFLFATSICADDMCSRSWFCAKSPHVRKPMKMKDKILSIVFLFWCVFMPFGCVFPLLCVHVSFRYVFTCGVFFCDYHVCPISFLRRLFVQMTCALDLGFARNPHMQENQWKWKTKFFQLCFPFGVFSCLLDVFSLCCVFMCLFDMCSRVVFFSVIIMCVQFPFCDVYLCRWHVLSILVLREIPTCKKANENERQNSFNCVSLLVCFHAFWMCFPFVVCSCVFSICVHVWCFFLWLSCVSNFLFATSICADDMCSRSWFCAKSPHARKPMKMKDKILSIVFPFWCVFMPFGCVFPLLCVHVSFRYVFTCGVFSCDYHVCPISFLRRLFVQMTCALDLGFARNPHM